jgi:dihydrolipoamide dehydrogenase
MSFQYDILIIGSGPGGYKAAVTGVSLGAKICLIEKDELGGICVNKGCIPTKAIIHSAILYNKIKNSSKYGIRIKDISLNYSEMVLNARNVVSNLRKGIEQVLRASKIDLIKGKAEIKSENTVEVNNNEITAKNIIVATGSMPKGLKGFSFDGRKILSSEEFLDITEIPKSILIVGGGVIGCEWAGIFASIGIPVTIVEAKDKILPEEDTDLSRVVEQGLKKMGVDIRVNTSLTSIEQEKAIISIGRDPVVSGLDILEKNQSGWVKVNEYLQTNIPNIYAVGDVIGQPLLAYTAGIEGDIAAKNANGQKIKISYDFMPRVVFSHPELAGVGMRENESENLGVVRAYFRGLGKALADDETEGFVKIIYDKSNHKLRGVSIVGKNASELINEATLALKCGLTTEQWSGKIWPHPVLSEVFGIALEKVK